MARVTAIVNQKGGVGKSTTAASLWAGLTERGLRCLAVDLDHQGNLTYSAGLNPGGPTIYGVLTGETDAASAVRETPWGDIITASLALAVADAVLDGTGRESRLKKALAPILGRYDHVVVDTPPALGILSVNAMVAADGIVVPALADIFSLQGIGQLSVAVDPVRRNFNPDLAVEGVLFTRHSGRSVVSREVMDLAVRMAARLGTKVFRSTVREGVAVREAQLLRKPVFDHAPKSKVASDYRAFIDELLGGWPDGK